jgi:class 3 adenylate cyclase
MTATRRLAAILAADVAGYSRLIGADEGRTLQALKAIRTELIDPTIAAHNGRLVKTTGDGLLVEFGSVPNARSMRPFACRSRDPRISGGVSPLLYSGVSSLYSAYRRKAA